MTDAAAPRRRSWDRDVSVARRLQTAVEPTAAWFYGFSVIMLVAGNAGGFFPTTYGWAAVVTLWLAAIVLVVRDRVALGVLDFAFVAALVLFSGWVALSAFWSPSVTSTMHDVHRDIAYIGIVAAGLVLGSRRTVPYLLGGVLVAVTLLCLYALGTRLLPDRIGSFDPEAAGYRLSTPITYWNGLGVFAAMGIVLALGMAARAKRPGSRALAASVIPILAVTLYFPFSRGAWAALCAGLLFAVFVDPRRLQLLAVACVLAPWPVLGVALASQREGLTTVDASLTDATSDGHALVLPLVLLSVFSGFVALGAAIFERQIRVWHSIRVGFAVLLVAVSCAAIVAAWESKGSPLHIARDAWSQFESPSKSSGANLTGRLFQLSSGGRIDLWRTAIDSFEQDKMKGNGAGTFWQLWAADTDATYATKETHSLYLDVLGELGLVGLVLLVAALSVPLVALLAGRKEPMATAAGMVYAVWLTHSAVDWDWELPGVSAVALLAAVALIAGARSPRAMASPRLKAVAIALCLGLGVIAIPALLAEERLSAGRSTLTSDPARALADGRMAHRLAPWSSEPYVLMARAYATEERKSAGRRMIRLAIERDTSNWELWRLLASYGSPTESRAARAKIDQLFPGHG